jgi:hypothetical protein
MTRLLAILFAAAPFVFALLRAFHTGSDFRFLWMAFASFLGAAVVTAVGKSRSGKPKGIIALSTLVLVLATLLAGFAAFLVGATSVVGAGAVAFAFGFCWAAGYALYALSRPRMI